MAIFVDHGPVKPDDVQFRGRENELAHLMQLCQGEVQAYGIVYGGRQTGKTSLLLRLEHMLPTVIPTCYVDWQACPGATSTQAYRYLAQRVADDLRYPLTASDTLYSAPDLTRFLCQALDQMNSTRMVLLVEEFGALPAATRLDLANVLRSLFTNRHSRSYRQLTRLMVILAGSIELYSLAASEVSTLHNVCEAIYLPDLSEPDALGLIADGLGNLGVSYDLAQALAQAIYLQVAGHPYLTQRLGRYLETALSCGKTLTLDDVGKAITQLLLDDPLLRHIRGALGEHELSGEALSLLSTPVRFSRLDESLARLELLGLASERDGHWQIRNPLLIRALQEWKAGLKKPETPSIPPATTQITVLQGDFHGTFASGERAVAIGGNADNNRFDSGDHINDDNTRSA